MTEPAAASLFYLLLLWAAALEDHRHRRCSIYWLALLALCGLYVMWGQWEVAQDRALLLYKMAGVGLLGLTFGIWRYVAKKALVMPADGAILALTILSLPTALALPVFLFLTGFFVLVYYGWLIKKQPKAVKIPFFPPMALALSFCWMAQGLGII